MGVTGTNVDMAALAARIPGIRLGPRLGAGAFGTVFAAEDPELGPVAVKVLAEGVRLDDARFQGIRAVEHPSLLRLHRHGVHEGRAYVIMERVEGRELLPTLRPPRPPVDPKRVRATIPLAFGQPVQEGGVSAFLPIAPDALRRLVPALEQLASALEALHRAGKVHRDVRPENVLITPEGRVVLVDYGLLSDEGVEHDDDAIAGSPAYMSPDDEVSPASDWYAFGVLLFEALTGALPFAGTAHEVIVRKRTVIAPSPSFVVSLPPEAAPLDELCVKLLRRARSMRATADDVFATLRAS